MQAYPRETYYFEGNKQQYGIRRTMKLISMVPRVSLVALKHM